MQRKSYNAFQGVSKLPILVPTTDPQSDDGVATFADPLKGPQPKVHIVNATEFLRDSLQKSLKPQDVEFVRGTAALQAAYKANDAVLAREAYITLMPFMDELGVPVDLPGGGHKFADHYSTKIRGVLRWPLNHYSRLISSALDEARVVFWWPTRGYSTLAIYCPTWKSAILIANYLERFRMCPCGKLFIPRKASTVCCSPKHTAYYRLKRWRDRKQPRKRSV